MNLGVYTVCFISFVIFYDDVTLELFVITDFRKKFLKGMVDAFYVGKYDENFFLTQAPVIGINRCRI